MPQTFRLKPVDPLTLMWGPDLNDPAIFSERATVSYAEFRKLRTQDGKKLGLDEAGKVYILGAGQSPENPKEQTADQTFSYIRENVRDPETGKWWCREYVCESGHSDSRAYGEFGELIQEYELPFDYPEYVICPSGREQLMEHDPHKRYVPILYELLVFTYELNFLLTLQSELALMEVAGEYVYADVSRASPEALRLFEAIPGYTVLEGAGAGPSAL